ncbi:MAG: amidohydrolase [Firmicutes bacterium]|nr:amidohydrolase [Bacillota bacterium]
MILIQKGNVYTMTCDEPMVADVLIDGGWIVKVEEDIVPHEGWTVIDASGKNVYPGFIDAHCHLGMWEEAIGFEGSDGNEAVDPVTPQLRAIDGFNPVDRAVEEAMQAGVTTVATGPGSANVIGGQFAVLKTHGKRVDNMIVKSPLAMKVAFGENPKRVYNGKGKSPITRMATAAVLRQALNDARNYLHKKEKDPETPIDFKLEPLTWVLKKEIPLKAHAHRADDIFTALRIAKEYDVNITLEHCTEGHLITDELAKENVKAIIGPSFGSRSKFELTNKTFDTPKAMYEAGIPFAIMTDHPVIPCQYLPLCAALSHKAGLPAIEAVKAITIRAAQILEVDDRLGSLEPGKDADIAIYEGDPMEDINARCIMTLINGQVVHNKQA